MSRNKKQLDKEFMFKKIMPSVAEDTPGDPQPPQTSGEPGPSPTLVPTSPPIPPLPPLPVPPETSKTPVPQAAAVVPHLHAVPADATPPEKAPGLCAEEQPASAASPQAEESDAPPCPQPELVNLMRIALENRLSDALKKFHCCECEQCRLDVLAIALNKVKPHYILLEPQQDPLSFVSADLSRDAVTALVQAIMVVKTHPRH